MPLFLPFYSSDPKQFLTLEYYFSAMTAQLILANLLITSLWGEEDRGSAQTCFHCANVCTSSSDLHVAPTATQTW